MTGPRQASRPRTAAGRRAPAAARSIGGRGARPARPSQRAPGEAAPDPAAPEREPGIDAEVEQEVDMSGMSAWDILLHDLDVLLHDPTPRRAIAAAVGKLTGGIRGLGIALADALRRLARALPHLRIPFPRGLLLAILALTLPFALVALLNGSDDDERTAPAPADQPAQTPPAGAGGVSLPGVGMPAVGAAPDRVRDVRVALVLDRSYDPATLRRELQTLGSWLAVNHSPGTRVSVIDAQTARASRPARAADLASARPERGRPSTSAAIRSAFGRERGRRLLVTVGTAPPKTTARTLRIATRRGAGAGSSAPLTDRRRASVTIDDRRPNALAANIARAIMASSGQREPR